MIIVTCDNITTARRLLNGFEALKNERSGINVKPIDMRRTNIHHNLSSRHVFWLFKALLINSTTLQ